MVEYTFDAAAIAEFLARTTPGPVGPDGQPCLLWTGATQFRDGKVRYGKWIVRVDGRAVTDYAHRIAWRMQTGTSPPKGLQLDHLCQRPLCVRVSHLQPVGELENTYRRTMRQRARKGRHAFLGPDETQCAHADAFATATVRCNQPRAAHAR